MAGRKLVEAANVGDAAFVADDNDLGPALNGSAVFASGGSGAASAGLRKDDLADAAVIANAVGDLADNAGHLGLFFRKNALTRQKQFEKDGPEKHCTSDSAEDREQKNGEVDQDAVAIQQITRCTEPAEEGSD